MAAKVKRTKTKHTGIYFNENTHKYDIKYNYKIYNPDTHKNDYKQKWKSGFATVKEAKSGILKLRDSIPAIETESITLQGAYQLWLVKAETQNFSPASVKNTACHLKMLYQFIPMETKMWDITSDIYEKTMNAVRKHGYSDETIRNINATFRKLINLCYRKGLTSTNIFCRLITSGQKRRMITG